VGCLSTLAMVIVSVGLQPVEDVVNDQVDLIEVNHFYDDQGRLVFDQVIFYDWSGIENRYQVRAWRLLKHNAQIPRRNWRSGEFESIWHDGDVLRRVRTKVIRETWTQFDPEILEREYLPKEHRRELRKLSSRKKAG
jgi:hypothetical protein